MMNTNNVTAKGDMLCPCLLYTSYALFGELFVVSFGHSTVYGRKPFSQVGGQVRVVCEYVAHGAVSYTHLVGGAVDVVHLDAAQGADGQLGTGEDDRLGKVLEHEAEGGGCIGPVSYTHLSISNNTIELCKATRLCS